MKLIKAKILLLILAIVSVSASFTDLEITKLSNAETEKRNKANEGLLKLQAQQMNARLSRKGENPFKNRHRSQRLSDSTPKISLKQFRRIIDTLNVYSKKTKPKHKYRKGIKLREQENKKLFGAISSALNYAGDLASKAIDKADKFIDKAGKTIADGAKAVGNAVVDGAKAVGNAVVDGAKAVGNAVSNGAKAVVNGAKAIGNAVGDAIDGAIDWGKNLISPEVKIVEPSKDKYEDDESDFDEDDFPEKKVVAEYDKSYGVPQPLKSGYIPNIYPDCLVENKLATKYDNDDDKNQKKLKKCSIKHIMKCVGMDKKLVKACAKSFKKTFPEHPSVKRYGFFLTEILKYASTIDVKAVYSKFSICGDKFIDEFLEKTSKYFSNFRICSSMIANIKNMYQSPPFAPVGFYFQKRRIAREQAKRRRR